MIYELTDTSKVEKLFDGCEFLETAVLSCLQKYAGNIFVTNTENPHSAIAYLGSFGFCAGKPDMELLLGKPDRFIHMVPQNEEWMKMIVSTFPATKKARYAIKKNAGFDREKLKTLVDALPAGYEIKRIDSDLYDMCLEDDDMEDLVCWFGPKNKFLTFGCGLVVMKDGK
ncbi:MAG: GNAT family N-acetyltransferase, partial [Oscillospiraceae bacterium]|nr:GNAT family N-acetyltransferase [Oscillospiraceae bacterium]